MSNGIALQILTALCLFWGGSVPLLFSLNMLRRLIFD